MLSALMGCKIAQHILANFRHGATESISKRACLQVCMCVLTVCLIFEVCITETLICFVY